MKIIFLLVAFSAFLQGEILCLAQSSGSSIPSKTTNEPAETSEFKSRLDREIPGLWENGVIGGGFRKGVSDLGFTLGGGIGLKALGSTRKHDLVLASIHYGRVISGVLAKDKWYAGNFELRGEIFGGKQISLHDAYIVGATPVLRYTFATGSRWVPFFDFGAGVTATDMKRPDLGSEFEFNSQGGPGIYFFCNRNLAITVQTRLMHISNAGIKHPNNGVNVIRIAGGISWFF
jgi:hypothetical protein